MNQLPSIIGRLCKDCESQLVLCHWDYRMAGCPKCRTIYRLPGLDNPIVNSVSDICQEGLLKIGFNDFGNYVYSDAALKQIQNFVASIATHPIYGHQDIQDSAIARNQVYLKAKELFETLLKDRSITPKTSSGLIQ